MRLPLAFLLASVALLALAAAPAGALTAQSCAAGNGCICGEWTGMIWAWRKFGPAKCCNPDFVFKGKSREQWESHLRGPVAKFIAAMEKKYGSQDTAACDGKGPAPELAPLLQAAWGNFDGEGLSCVCDPFSRPVCKGFLKDIKDPKKGQGKGAACGWKDNGDGAAAPAGGSSAGGGGAGASGTTGAPAAVSAAEPTEAEAPAPIPVSRRPAVEATLAVREAAPDCADPKNPDGLLDTPRCDLAAAAEVHKRIGPDYTAEQAAVYWGWYKTVSTRPSRKRPAKPRRSNNR